MILEHQSVWSLIDEVLQRELSAVSYDSWIRPLTSIGTETSALILEAPHECGKNMVVSKYMPILLATLESVQEQPFLNSVVIITPEEREEREKARAARPDKTELSEKGGNRQAKAEAEENNRSEPALTRRKEESSAFKPKLTFENFVVGKSNQYVYAMAQGVADEPGSRHNPLFIYGSTGLGKTHIMHAIGNRLLSERPELKVMYVPCEKFMNELIDAIGGGRQSGHDFREKYRTADVLMIDDIQTLAGKERTQEEFFHTFEDLFNNNKQIVMCSDRPPRDITPLSERLRSRFTWGMIADVQQPDLETRIAILQKKAQIERFNIKNDALTFIAEKINSNIRDMEGMLSRVVYYAQLENRSPTVDLAREVLKDFIEDSQEAMTTDIIIDNVCSYFKAQKEELVGRRKTKEIVEPRMMAIYLITEILDSIPLVKIGQIFGGRDHTTIIHARDKISEQIKNNPRVRIAVQDIKNMISKA